MSMPATLHRHNVFGMLRAGLRSAKDTEASRQRETFGEADRDCRECQFSGVPQITRSRAHAAISFIYSENAERLKTGWRREEDLNSSPLSNR